MLVSVFCLVLHISAANTGSVMLAVFVTNPLGGLPGGIAECSRGVPRRGTGWRSEEHRGGQAGGLRSGCFRDRSPFSAPVRRQVEMAAVGGAEVRLSRQAACFRGVIPHRSWWFGTPSTPSAPPAHHQYPQRTIAAPGSAVPAAEPCNCCHLLHCAQEPGDHFVCSCREKAKPSTP